ncbi:MAG TPA: ABC-F family ATP-binding cassette domain-containing protein [Caulobacterales bacterium]|nr:ABC-F family ATP-binding cassette domain-containing protein [Caulobacterales bacterium]
MLEIRDLTYRIAGRALFDGASAFIAEGWKVGLIGRNGTGKTTLLRLIREEVGKPNASISIRRGARMGFVAQEVPQVDTPLMEIVLAADEELAALTAESETATDPHRIADIHTRLAEIDAYSAEARASAILVGLGFAQEDLQRPAREFSGGWRMRAALAGVLFSSPDLLVLDEPTNYLDLEGAAWLEDYLQCYPHTVIVVSHDREMLNRSVTHVLALDDKKLEVHVGGYDAYLKKRAERAALQGALKAKQDAQRAHLQKFVDRFRAKASKARQAQSRIKQLEKMQDIPVPLEDRTTPFHFEDPSELASPLIVLDQCQLGYVKGKPVLTHVSLRLDHDDRIVVIGPNGQGKTTLVKSIGGKLALLSGKRTASSKVSIGYFSQDQLDELRAGETVLEHVRDLEPGWAPPKQRALAARMGFGVEKIDTKVENLSGGEKVRLLLGLMAHAKPHVLILDEPTSHLDIDSREALILAINEYEGAVLLITHDIYLAEACADRLWLVHNGRVRPYDGDLDDYRELVLSADRPGAHKIPDAVEAKPKPAKAGKASFTMQQRLLKAEKALEAAQADLARIDAALADPAAFTRDAVGAGALAKQRDAAAQALARAEEEWLEASAAIEA